MKNKILTTLLLTLVIGLKNTQAQFYNNGAEVTIQSGATVTVEGDFVNSAASNLKNSGTLELKRYVTNNQYMNNDYGGLWKFNGLSTQKISGSEQIWMYILALDNPGGFLLQNSLYINKQVEFYNGIMEAENLGNMVFYSKNGQISTPAPSDDSHINGEVVKEGENQTFKYPVGNGKKYQPIEVAFADNGNENGLLAKYYDTDAGSAPFGGNGSEATLLNSYNSKEYWDLIPMNNGITKGTVKVFWDSFNDGYSEGASLRRVAHLSSITSKWENEGTNTGIGTPSSGFVVSNQISNWSPFTLGTVAAVALPIRLVNFSGKKVGETNLLNWQTNLEINASHFEIERSTDAKEFEKIGEVKATHKIFELAYEYQDRTPPSGSGVMYRLKLVDLDGKYIYSKIIYLENNDNEMVVSNFYPNPAIGNQSNIDINAIEKATWTISTVDLTGQIIKSDRRVMEKGLNTLQFDSIQKGVNIIHFENNGKIVVRKLINIQF